MEPVVTDGENELGQCSHPEALWVYCLDIPSRTRSSGQVVLSGLGMSRCLTAADHDQAEHLRQALASREVIGQAQGILIERERITADQAFDLLRRASQHLNVKLREVAQDVVDTGVAPPSDTGQRPR